MPPKFIAPDISARTFTCPRCHTVAAQVAAPVKVASYTLGMSVTRCEACGDGSVWEQDPAGDRHLVWPTSRFAPLPNTDMPVDVLRDYEEAASILHLSPRGSAALLRLALQRLCVDLGEPGKNINDDIGALVAKGKVNTLIQQAMDTVRIVGNEAVHPGEINLDDDQDLALALFEFVNLIAEQAISTPKKVGTIYDRLPEAKLDAVVKRDGSGST